MRKIGVVIVLAAGAGALAFLLLRAGQSDPPITGTWRELRPPTFE